ncbi:hypothetical protein YC2023_102561 [Brassica napus]
MCQSNRWYYREGGVGKYLGLPELFGRRKRDLFASIVDRINQKAMSWSSRRLSSAGKLTMLKAVLSATPTYSMSCFELPLGLCNQIQSAFTRFWWDESPNKKKMCWIAWDELTEPKSSGGLGIRDVHDFNVALLAKLAWRIYTRSECLLACLLLGKYCHSTSFHLVQCPSSTSHGWRSVLIGRDLIVSKLGKAIGNGASTKIWRDTWMSPIVPVKPFGPTRECDQGLVVADLLSLDSSHWIKSKVEEIFPDVAHHIMRIVPSSMGSEDSFIWCGTKSGSYSVKSGYLAIKEHQKSHRPTLTHEETLDWQQFVWSITSSPKLKLFLWKLCRGALPLGANLAARGLTAAKTCPHCGVEETALHLFFQCPFAVQVWMLAPLRAPFDSASCHSLEAGIQEASEVVCVLPTGIVGNLSSWICWFIWTTRNQLVFENRHISALNTLSHALAAAREWQTAQQNGTQVSSGTHTHSVEMITTPPGTVLCNTDASWTLESGAAGLGWLFDYT